MIYYTRRHHTMERTALKQSQLCGSWEMKERLGMGGFGHVYLYQHLVSSVVHLYADENINLSPRWAFGVVLFPVCVWSRSRERRLLWNFAAWSSTPRTKTAGAERFRSWRSECNSKRLRGFKKNLMNILQCAFYSCVLWSLLVTGSTTWMWFRPEKFLKSCAPLL